MTVLMNASSQTFVVESVEEFVKRLAVLLVPNGYFFYVLGKVPEGKDPLAVDRKLVGKYGLDVSKWARYRQKKRGEAKIQYLRHKGTFVLVATHGHSSFFAEEPFKDLRRSPLKVFGYALSHRGGHSHVRVELEEFKRLRQHFAGSAVKRSEAELFSMLRGLPFEPYAPVRRQYLQLLRDVNRRRKAAGLERVRVEAVRLRRSTSETRQLRGTPGAMHPAESSDGRSPGPLS